MPFPRSLRSRGYFRGHWGQIWISSSFYKFSFRIFVVVGFEVVWPRRPQQPQKGLREFFLKVTFLKSVHSKEKDEVCLCFLVTKSLHRGGVIEERWLLKLAILYQIMYECFIKVLSKWEKSSFIKDFTPLLLLRLCLLSVNHRRFFFYSVTTKCYNSTLDKTKSRGTHCCLATTFVKNSCFFVKLKRKRKIGEHLMDNFPP